MDQSVDVTVTSQLDREDVYQLQKCKERKLDLLVIRSGKQCGNVILQHILVKVTLRHRLQQLLKHHHIKGNMLIEQNL